MSGCRFNRIQSLLFLISFCLFILAGCSELGLLDSTLSDPMIHVLLIDSIVKPGDKIGIQIHAADILPDKVLSRLEHQNGNSLDLMLVPPADGWNSGSGSSGELLIPDSVPEGYYVLVSEAWLDEKLLSEDRVDILILNGEWAINSLELFPPQSIPGGVFYSHVLLDIPEGSNPWLKWIQNEELVGQGFLLDGWDTIVLDAGDRPGVHPLILELYLDDNANGLLPIRVFSTELYTSKSIPAGTDNLSPSESYAFLQHFDGKLDGNPEILGKPRPVITSRGMGFRFASGEGMNWNHIPMPRDHSDEWPPFSLTVGLLADWEDEGRLLALGDERFSLTLSLSAERELILKLNNDDHYASILHLPETEDESIAVTLSFFPEKENLNLVWLIDGDTVAQSRWTPLPEPPGDSLRISLGGDAGFSGVVTELALHAPGIEIDHFSFYRDIGGKKLIAEGFEDADLHKSIEITPDMVVDGGSLILPPGRTLSFPGGSGGELSFKTFPNEDSAVLSVYSLLTGKVLKQSTIKGEITEDSSDRIRFLLEKNDGISDNERDTVYELRTSSRNTSNLRLEYILVDQKQL